MDSIIQRLGTKNMWLISMAYVYSSSEFGAGPGNIRDLVRAENDYLARQKAKYPATVEANYGIDPMTGFAMEDIARCNDSLKVDGLKLHFNAAHVYLTERKYQEKVKQVLGYAAGHQIPVLLHFDNSHRRFSMDNLVFGTDYPLYSSQEYLDVLRKKVKLREEEMAVLLREK